MTREFHRHAPAARLAPHRGHGSLPSVALAVWLLGASLVARASSAEPAPSPPFRGNMPAREYSFEEIGPVYGGLRFGSDAIGRLIVTRESAHLVFDGTAWVEILDSQGLNPNLICTALDSDGQVYCGGAGFWGVLQYSSSRAARMQSFRPVNPPEWIANNSFLQVIPTRQGAFFVGVSGGVFRWRRTGEQRFMETSGTRSGFALGDSVYLSTRANSVLALNTVSGALTQLDPALMGGVIGLSTEWDTGRVLVTVDDSRLAFFDGDKLEPWPTEIDSLLSSGVTAMRRLEDDRVVIAVRGHGLQFLDRRGHCVRTLDGGRYSGVIDLFHNEPGVLWVSSSSGVAKVLYDSPVDVFDQGLGLELDWPEPFFHHGDPFVLSSGHVYQGIAGRAGLANRFEMLRSMDMPGGVWSAADSPHGILFGSNRGVHVLRDDGTVTTVFDGFAVNRLWMTDDRRESCLVLSSDRLALLQWNGSTWHETAPRVSGLGYPSLLASAAANSLWIELGVNRVGHITVRDGSLHTEVLTPFQTGVSDWANLGAIGRYIVISRAGSDRVYYDEAAGRFCPPPAIDGVLKAAPYWTLRPQQDASGVIWAPYAHGMFRLLPTESGYRVDGDTFRVVQDGFPLVDILGKRDVWVRTERRLLHLSAGPALPPPPLKPRLVGVVDSRTDTELWSNLDRDRPPLSVPYGSNSLDFHVFPGTNALLQDPAYQFMLEGYSDQWSAITRSAVINLTQLHEGDYRLHVRLVRDAAPLGEPLDFPFTVRPPLYRTWYAYTGYVLFCAAAVLGLVRLRERTLRSRNQALEALVAERTEDLRRNNQNLQTAFLHLEKLAGDARESELRFRRMANNAPVMIWMSDAAGRWVFANETWRRHTGRPEAELLGDGWSTSIHPDDRERVLALHAQAHRNQDSFACEYRLVKLDGGPGWVRVLAQPLREDPDGRGGLIGSCIDITEVRKAQEERLSIERSIQQTQRLESLGVLAGGIAHDFNNLLMVIMGNASLLQLDAVESSDSGLMLGEIRKASTKAAELCQQMLAYAGSSRHQVRPVDLSALVGTTVGLLQSRVDTRISFALELGSGLPGVVADPAQIQQLITNLLTNAVEAIGSRTGTIRVRTAIVHDLQLGPGQLVLAPAAGRPPMVSLEVTDDGPGIAPEGVGRVFEPFFTTKELGRGLGLSAVHGIVKTHKGLLRLKSEPGGGCTFWIALPCEAAPSAPAAPLPDDETWKGRGRVLVVDDEASVRDSVRRMLAGLGFESVEADGGRQALHLHASQPPFDLVVLDLVMPVCDGSEVLAELTRRDPQLRILLISGFNLIDQPDGAPVGTRTAFLQKPFDLAAFRSAVRRLLEAPTPGAKA